MLLKPWVWLLLSISCKWSQREWTRQRALPCTPCSWKGTSLDTQPTPQNETVWAGKVDGLIPPPTGMVTYVGQWLPFPGASCCCAPTSSALLCCMQIACTTHWEFCEQCHVLVSSSACFSCFNLRWVMYFTPDSSSSRKPTQVRCSYCSYHIIFHAVVIHINFHSPLEGFMAIRYCQITFFNWQKSLHFSILGACHITCRI